MKNPLPRRLPGAVFALPLMILAAFGLAACSEDKSVEKTAEPKAEAGTAPETNAAGTTAPPAPRDLGQAMQDRIRSGAWTQEQALVENLRILAGERSEKEVYGDEPVVLHEGTGLLIAARQYLENGDDEAAKTEMRRLISRVVPEREWLQQRSRTVDRLPARDPQKGSTAAVPRIGFSIISEAYADPTCEELWAADQPPRSAVSSRMECFDRLAERLPDGHDLEVYYPTRWRWGGPRLDYVAAAREAVIESVRRFRAPPIGMLSSGGIYVVLGEHEERGAKFHVLANAASTPSGWCGVSVWRRGYDTSMVRDLDAFRQLMAHETFHCFQGWSITRSNVRFPASNWWHEAIPEYFSNVVYPCTDFENRFLGEFHTTIRDKPIFATNYANFVFFQYLANHHRGPGEVLRMQRALAQTPLADQPRRFASWPGMTTRFRDFAEAYADGKIADACPGRNIPAPPPPPVLPIAHGTEREIGTPGFSIPLRELRFDEKEYRLTKNTSDGSTARDRARDKRDLLWAPLPSLPNIAPACLARPRRYLWFPVNTSLDPITFVLADESSPGAAGAAADAPASGGGPIDRCLVGRWEVDVEGIFALSPWFDSMNPENDPNRRRFQGMVGNAVTEFTAGGRMFGETQALQPSVLINRPERRRGRHQDVVVPASSREMSVRINSASCARWSAAGGLLTLSDIQEDVRAETIVKTGDGRTIIQNVSPGAPLPGRDFLEKAMQTRAPSAQNEAMRNIWREIVEPIMEEEAGRPITGDDRRQVREVLAGNVETGRAAETIEMRYRCSGDTAEIQLPVADLPWVRMRRRD